MLKLIVFAFFFISSSSNLDPDLELQYEGYKLIRLTPRTDVEAILLQDLFLKSKVFQNFVVFKNSRGRNDYSEFLVPPRQLADLQIILETTGAFQAEIISENYAKSLRKDVPSRRSLGFNINNYNSYDEIMSYLHGIAKQYPNIVTLETRGKSYEGRPLVLVKLSKDKHAHNPVIFIDAGIHAREWVAPAAALYLIHTILKSPNGADALLKNVDFYILPLVNPDGYEFSRSSVRSRLWRKTRSKSPNGCIGVDGNRNYDFKWATSGVSKDACDPETFAGAHAFSEPETQTVAGIMFDPRIKLYVSLHAYGQYLVYPWGYTGSVLPPQAPKLKNLALRASDAVVRAGGKRFNVMSAGQWYPAAGGSDDFAFAVAKIPYSFTMELTDGYNFNFPENLLASTLPQFMPAFGVFARQIAHEFNKR